MPTPPRRVQFDRLVEQVHAANPDLPRARIEKIVTLTLILAKGKRGLR